MSDNEEIQNHLDKNTLNDIKNLNQKYQKIIDNYKLYNEDFI